MSSIAEIEGQNCGLPTQATLAPSFQPTLAPDCARPWLWTMPGFTLRITRLGDRSRPLCEDAMLGTAPPHQESQEAATPGGVVTILGQEATMGGLTGNIFMQRVVCVWNELPEEVVEV
eukprot:g20386.t1